MGGVLALAVGYAAATPAPPSGGALTVTCSPTSSAGVGTAPPNICPSVTTFVSGGSGSYTYAWASDTITSGTLTILSPTSRTTSFRFDTLDGGVGEATVEVTVTDAVTSNTGSAIVAVTYQDL